MSKHLLANKIGQRNWRLRTCMAFYVAEVYGTRRLGPCQSYDKGFQWYSHGSGEKGSDTWYTPKKKKKNKMAMENHSF